MSSAIIMSQSRDKILPPRPMPTIVGLLIPVTVLVPTVKPLCDHDLAVFVLGLNFIPGPHISSKFLVTLARLTKKSSKCVNPLVKETHLAVKSYLKVFPSVT
jgi:hypothetical protein